MVRQLYGAMVGEEAHAAIFVTSGSYTPDAIAFAHDKPIKLVDGRELVGARDWTGEGVTPPTGPPALLQRKNPTHFAQDSGRHDWVKSAT